MILSLKHKFIFIKGLKVAGTSVEMGLASICGPSDIICPITAIDERARAPHNARNYSRDPAAEREYISAVMRGEDVELPQSRYNGHMSLQAVAKKFGDVAGFQILFVERNPYAKVLSLANTRGGRFETYKQSGQPMRSTIEEVRYLVDKGLETGRVTAVKNIDRYRLDGHVPAGWRYETLAQQLSEWAADKGPIALPHAKPGMMSDTLDVKEWLTGAQISRITELFWDEFMTFGYRPLAGC